MKCPKCGYEIPEFDDEDEGETFDLFKDVGTKWKVDPELLIKRLPA